MAKRRNYPAKSHIAVLDSTRINQDLTIVPGHLLVSLLGYSIIISKSAREYNVVANT